MITVGERVALWATEQSAVLSELAGSSTMVETRAEPDEGHAFIRILRLSDKSEIFMLEIALSGDWQDPGLGYDAEIGSEVEVRLRVHSGQGMLRRSRKYAADYTLDRAPEGDRQDPIPHRLIDGPLGVPMREALLRSAT